ncbi:GNAT family N-acetyltransferase [Streptomyces sp. NPDC001777]|uniref:GNAT family N-acetyltransferase n=1 Tax=Streptomyces sp. NPDC001777 TaxID=3364608 RepID=UPI0036C459EF
MVTCDADTVLVARTDGTIVGTLTLVTLPLSSGARARIEDVVVDDEARGRRAAGLLAEKALRIARQAGARTVDPTSRPDRAAVNRLYERLGFRARQSTVYRFPLDGWRNPAGTAVQHPCALSDATGFAATESQTTRWVERTTRSSEPGQCRPGRALLHLEHAPGRQREGTPRVSSVVMVLPGAAAVSASRFPSWKGRPICSQTMSDQVRP